MALAAGDVWLNNGHNLLMFGPPGTGKSHLSSAIGLALVENGYRVLFTRTTDLVQRLQRARRELTLENLLARLDRYHLLILDDFAYVSKDQMETSVLFELISVRYERRSILITANQPFDQWHKVFPTPATGFKRTLQSALYGRFTAFSACVIGCGCWEHLMSVESMRRQLNALQYSVLMKSAADEKYAMPSRASAQAKRIYRSVSLSWNESPFRLRAEG